MNVSEPEIVNLLYGAAAAVTLFLTHRQLAIPKAQPFYLGFGILLSAYLFSVLEGLLMPDFFNLLEHGAFALSGLFFAAGLLDWGSGSGELP